MGNIYTILDRKTGQPVRRNEEISPQDFELLNKIYPSEKRCIDTKNLELIEKSRNIPEKLAVKNITVAVKSWILVLNTRYLSNVPLIIDGKGQSKEIEFTFESGTEVEYSCSIVWQGKMFVFGGYNYRRQISVVDQCRLKKKGVLPFDMITGACAQNENREVFICFQNYRDSSTWKSCRRSSGPLGNFSKLPNSKYDHRDARIAVTSGESNLLFNLVLLFRLPDRCWRSIPK